VQASSILNGLDILLCTSTLQYEVIQAETHFIAIFSSSP